MTQRIGNPFPMFFDRYGRPLTGGDVYIGEAGADPETTPVDAFYDAELTIAATQPIPTIGGMLARDGSPTLIYVAENQFSVRVRDADEAEVFYVASANPSTDEFQPLDSDLTAIAALATTAFGRALLTKANAADVRSYLDLVASLPLTGGTVTGAILRQSAGAHLYFVDSALSTGRVYVTASGAADPRADPTKDIWLEEEPA